MQQPPSFFGWNPGPLPPCPTPAPRGCAIMGHFISLLSQAPRPSSSSPDILPPHQHTQPDCVSSIAGVCQDFVKCLVASPVLLDRLRQTCEGQVISYGSWYAGVNAIAVALRHLSMALREIAHIKVTFRCSYAVECDTKCHQFIQSMLECDRPLYLFRDAEELVSETGLGYDIISQAWVLPPDVPILIAGCECGILSMLNVSRKRQRQCLQS